MNLLTFNKRFIFFLVPPTILDGPLNISVIVGLNVTLPCHVEGRPSPNVTWIKDSEIINYRPG